MPYYNGSAANYAALRTALFNACLDNGWSLSTDVLTKGTLAIKFTIVTVEAANDSIGLVMQGGTGATGATLINPSDNRARLGPVVNASDLAWPVTYEIFLQTNPDEVYLVVKSNIVEHYFLAFGKSTCPGIGLWFSGTGPRKVLSATNGIAMNVAGGPNNGYASGAIFWRPLANPVGGAIYNQDSVHIGGLEGFTWAGISAAGFAQSPGSFSAIEQATTLLAVQPNAWNSAAVPLRIRPILWRASSKNSVIADLAFARYIRVDNYESGQIISYGPDNWKVFPFHRKNTTARNGGAGINHTGTFGWCIRYDGPM